MSPLSFQTPVAKAAGLRVLALFGTAAALLGVLLLLVRPWYVTWGTTEAERLRALPGDEFGSRSPRETRAISIAAPAERVFAWVAQLGQNRGGFYSYELLEDLAGCEMPRVEHLDPQLQRWSVGDRLWMYPPDELGGMGYATLLEYQPGHALVFGTHTPSQRPGSAASGTWAFVVEPTGEAASRLIVRGSGSAPPSLLGVAFNRTVFEPMHFAMERRMLQGIAGLAQGRGPSRTEDNLMLCLWAAAFGMFVSSAVLVALGMRWQRRLASFVAAGICFQILTLVQPPLWLGIPLVLGLAWLTWTPKRAPVSTLQRLEVVS